MCRMFSVPTFRTVLFGGCDENNNILTVLNALDVWYLIGWLVG